MTRRTARDLIVLLGAVALLFGTIIRSDLSRYLDQNPQWAHKGSDSGVADFAGSSWRFTKVMPLPKDRRASDFGTGDKIADPKGARIVIADLTVISHSKRAIKLAGGCDLRLRDTEGRVWDAGALVPFEAISASADKPDISLGSSCSGTWDAKPKVNKPITNTIAFLVPENVDLEDLSLEITLTWKVKHRLGTDRDRVHLLRLQTSP